MSGLKKHGLSTIRPGPVVIRAGPARHFESPKHDGLVPGQHGMAHLAGLVATLTGRPATSKPEAGHAGGMR
jgi:hypothetical protein